PTLPTLPTLPAENPRDYTENLTSVSRPATDVTDVATDVRRNGRANVGANAGKTRANVGKNRATDVDRGPKNGVDTPEFATSVGNVGNVGSLPTLGSAGPVQAAPTPARTLITDAGAVSELLPSLMAAPVLGLDTETTGLDPRQDRVRLLQLATADQVYLVDLFPLGDGLQLLAPLFAAADGPRLIMHHAGFDLAMLQASGLPPPPSARLVDTMLLAQLLSAGAPEFYHCGLADETARTLGWVLDKTLQRAD